VCTKKRIIVPPVMSYLSPPPLHPRGWREREGGGRRPDSSIYTLIYYTIKE